MTSIAELLKQMGSVATDIDGIAAKLQHPKLYPSSHVLESADALVKQITSCKPAWTHTVRSQSAKDMSAAELATQEMMQGRVKLPTFKRNLAAIFQAQQPPSGDSPALTRVKARAKKRRQRLCGLKPEAIMKWAASFLPHEWERMRQNVFDDIVDRIAEKPFFWPTIARAKQPSTLAGPSELDMTLADAEKLWPNWKQQCVSVVVEQASRQGQTKMRQTWFAMCSHSFSSSSTISSGRGTESGALMSSPTSTTLFSSRRKKQEGMFGEDKAGHDEMWE
ncbi:hypothetical protein BU26DRAFT_500001 [Trematosphaeria pertusa]|uniref:Uncharacterized protein n=1 Tax=Trematosphaeria pertusa TaxID=390896 RepID=A0A6A6IW90_9PLEO|nr:uncharacterized protein BU26DRAFT_500001 [Trematosphaeria pertusa]KAF2254202.1 hypothetical protein BU26DRAFT_500001 [Trematosphaeria pertusa]